MKKVAKPVFFIVALILVLFTCAAFLGYNVQFGDIDRIYLKGLDDIEWGLDLGGGVQSTFTPLDSTDVTDETLNQAVSVIEQRLVNKGITDSHVLVDNDTKTIVVRFALKEGKEVADELQDIGRTGELAFYKDTPLDSTTGMLSNDAGDPILTGEDVDYAELTLYPDSETGKMVSAVSLVFKDEAKDIWEQATGEQVGGRISIFLDGQMISSPSVDQAISDGRCVISGDYGSGEAIDLVNRINGGTLPFALESSHYGAITPTYGDYARRALGIAAVAGLAVVILVLLVRSRLTGLVAAISLIAQLGGAVAVVTGFFSVLPAFTLSTPAVMGTAVAFAFAVGAQLHMARCIKKQLKTNKEVPVAVQQGGKDAFPMILDGFVALLLAGVALLVVFGPGNSMFTSPINTLFGWLGFESTAASALYSFAYPMVAGIVLAMLFQVLASRLMLRSLSSFAGLNKAWLFGGDR